MVEEEPLEVLNRLQYQRLHLQYFSSHKHHRDHHNHQEEDNQL